VQVGGALLGFAVERISVGMQHVAAQASPLDKKTGLPQLGSEFSGLFMWGRGREGQLGVATYQDNSVPKIVDDLKGRRVLQVPHCTPLPLATSSTNLQHEQNLSLPGFDSQEAVSASQRGEFQSHHSCKPNW